MRPKDTKNDQGCQEIISITRGLYQLAAHAHLEKRIAEDRAGAYGYFDPDGGSYPAAR